MDPVRSGKAVTGQGQLGYAGRTLRSRPDLPKLERLAREVTRICHQRKHLEVGAASTPKAFAQAAGRQP
jgi:hypothetical protein